MQLALTAKNNTDSVRSNLTYINTLVTDAASNGQTVIFIDGVFMDDSMADTLRGLGYHITKEYFDFGSYPRYIIKFS